MIFKIIFLCSGNGGNLKFIHQFFTNPKSPYSNIQIIRVIADRECGAIEYALKNNIKFNIHSFMKNEIEDAKLIEMLEADKPDIIVSNVHKILSTRIVNQYMGKLINLHYSLLPAFGGYIGMKPLELAIQQGCRFAGATVHFVSEDVDMGPIISQGVFLIEDRDREKVINDMFKTGCIALLNGIAKTLHLKTITNQTYYNITFSPAYDTDKIYLDKIFLTI